MALDINKLTGIKRLGDKIKAQCPACALDGGDRGMEHLVIFRDGAYGCAVDRSVEHSAVIWQLAGSPEGETTLVAPPEPQIEIERTWPASDLQKLVADHSYWEKRGVATEIVAPCQGGVALRGQMKDRYVIPIFNDDDEVIGFTGRALRPDMKPKWKHLGKVSSWVWGGLEEIRATRQAILVEGAGCRFALDGRGHRNSLVLWGVHVSGAVLGALIAANPTDIAIATNNDPGRLNPGTGRSSFPGQEAAVRAKLILDNFFDPGVVRIVLPEAKDFLDQDAANWTAWEARLTPAVCPSGDLDGECS